MVKHTSSNNGLKGVKRNNEKMKWLMDSMIAYWILLLIISLGAASVIYLFWLRDVLM